MKPESVDDWRYLGEEPKAYERYNIKLGEKNVGPNPAVSPSYSSW